MQNCIHFIPGIIENHRLGDSGLKFYCLHCRCRSISTVSPTATEEEKEPSCVSSVPSSPFEAHQRQHAPPSWLGAQGGPQPPDHQQGGTGPREGSWSNVVRGGFLCFYFVVNVKNVLTVWFRLPWRALVCSAKKEPLVLLPAGVGGPLRPGPGACAPKLRLRRQTEASRVVCGGRGAGGAGGRGE